MKCPECEEALVITEFTSQLGVSSYNAVCLECGYELNGTTDP